VGVLTPFHLLRRVDAAGGEREKNSRFSPSSGAQQGKGKKGGDIFPSSSRRCENSSLLSGSWRGERGEVIEAPPGEDREEKLRTSAMLTSPRLRNKGGKMGSRGLQVPPPLFGQ